MPSCAYRQAQVELDIHISPRFNNFHLDLTLICFARSRDGALKLHLCYHAHVCAIAGDGKQSRWKKCCTQAALFKWLPCAGPLSHAIKNTLINMFLDVL